MVKSEVRSKYAVPYSPDERKLLKSIGNNLRRLRAAKGLSQERLAELCSLHPRALQKVEGAEVAASVLTLAKLCRALGCSADKLIPPN